MYDVGGERSERKKWLRGMVERAAVAIFFVPMSGYFQPLYEDRHGVCLHLILAHSQILMATLGPNARISYAL